MQEKLMRITEKTLIVGVDIAKNMHWARITNYRGIEVAKPVKVPNTREGFDNLMDKVEKLRVAGGCDQVMIGMEPTGHYWKPFVWYLYLHESRPIPVGINPRKTKQAQEMDDNAPTKSDRKDAMTIAHLVRDGRFYDIYLPEGAYAELRVLTAERKRLQKQVIRTKNTVVALADEYFPEYGQVWSDVTCVTSQAVLRACPFPNDILEMDTNRLTQLLKKASGGVEGRDRVRQLRAAAAESLGVTVGTDSVRLRLNNLLTEMALYEAFLKEIDQRMAEVMEQLELGEILQSMKGVGPVLSAIFLGEIGDITRFDNWKQLRRLAGLNLVEDSSGKHKGKTRISRRGRPHLRYMLFMAGQTCSRHNPEMHAYYRCLRERRHNPLTGYQAFVAVGLKVLRILFYLAKNRTTYDPAKALGAVREQQIATLAA